MKQETKLCLILSLLAVLIDSQVEGRILTQCEAVQELQRAKVQRSLISNWVCLMESESGLNTQLITGPKTASSYSYGIFQINSAKWCSRGHSGGICNKRCEDFANDDITDDIECAKKIQSMEGFKAWDGWMKKCKNKPLPNIGNCKRRRRRRRVTAAFDFPIQALPTLHTLQTLHTLHTLHTLPFPVPRNRYPETPVVKVTQPFHENCPLKGPNGTLMLNGTLFTVRPIP